MWKSPINLDLLNSTAPNTLVERLGIEFCGYGDDYLQAKMPVDDRTVQPFRILHGGASAALAETVGSVASLLCLDDIGKQYAVGLELNASHLRSASSGWVIATARAARIGRKIHVWNIDISDEAGKLVCTSRLTMAIVER
jgi:1,4-dihydroxy-2-naphthoyl-CoA hydrolase